VERGGRAGRVANECGDVRLSVEQVELCHTRRIRSAGRRFLPWKRRAFRCGRGRELFAVLGPNAKAGNRRFLRLIAGALQPFIGAKFLLKRRGDAT